MRFAPLLLTLIACKGPPVEVSGTLGGAPFDEAKTAFFAGPHILLFAGEVDCIDTSWVERAYQTTEPPTDLEMRALQFSAMEEDSYALGTYTFVPNSPVRSYGLTNGADGFVADRGREGYVAITDADKGGQWLEGEFDVTFTTDHVTGTFRAEYCRNMQP